LGSAEPVEEHKTTLWGQENRVGHAAICQHPAWGAAELRRTLDEVLILAFGLEVSAMLAVVGAMEVATYTLARL